MIDDEYLDFACPKCGQPVGAECVYMPVNPGHELTYYHTRHPKVQARLDRVGTPTKRPHNERVNLVAERHRKRIQRQRVAEKYANIKITPASTEQRAIWKSLRDHDHREYEQLKTWFAAHGHIFR